mmetsp:Transcript_19363/g.58458  ORF Transcript_19363/g.58458 Transcript_19363/m.58458 type:complete len:221 (-) Transcript_19363:529-1191(-)
MVRPVERCSSSCGIASASSVTRMSCAFTTWLPKASRARTTTVTTSPALTCRGRADIELEAAPVDALTSPPSTLSLAAMRPTATSTSGPLAVRWSFVTVMERICMVAFVNSFRSRRSAANPFACRAVLSRMESEPRANMIEPACVQSTGRKPRPLNTSNLGATPPGIRASPDSSRANSPLYDSHTFACRSTTAMATFRGAPVGCGLNGASPMSNIAQTGSR